MIARPRAGARFGDRHLEDDRRFQQRVSNSPTPPFTIAAPRLPAQCRTSTKHSTSPKYSYVSSPAAVRSYRITSSSSSVMIGGPCSISVAVTKAVNPEMSARTRNPCFAASSPRAWATSSARIASRTACCRSSSPPTRLRRSHRPRAAPVGVFRSRVAFVSQERDGRAFRRRHRQSPGQGRWEADRLAAADRERDAVERAPRSEELRYVFDADQLDVHDTCLRAQRRLFLLMKGDPMGFGRVIRDKN